MRTVPKADGELIQFALAHVDVWAADPAAIGLTPQDIAALRAVLSTAQTQRIAAGMARDAARSATVTAGRSAAALRAMCSQLVTTIKMFARNDDGVLAAAQINPPLPGSPAPPPGEPLNPHATLDSGGALTLTWEPSGPTGTRRGPGSRGGDGTVFIVERLVRSGRAIVEPQSIVAVVGEARYIDPAPPLARYADATIEYRVRTRRGAKESPQSWAAIVSLAPAASPRPARMAA